MRLAESRPAELQEVLRPLLSLIARLLTEAMDSGDIRRADLGRLAGYMYNLVSTTAHTEFLSGGSSVQDTDKRQVLAEEIWDFCFRAICL